MIKARSIYTVDFCRDKAFPSIEVKLMKGNETISLHHNSIAYYSKVLSQKEIKTIIEILETKKEVMLKERDFPSVYDEMLDDLITAYEERYGKRAKKVNKRLSHYCLTINQLEKLIEQCYNFKDVHIDSIYAGSNSHDTIKMDVGSRKGFLEVSFSTAEEA